VSVNSDDFCEMSHMYRGSVTLPVCNHQLIGEIAHTDTYTNIPIRS